MTVAASRSYEEVAELLEQAAAQLALVRRGALILWNERKDKLARMDGDNEAVAALDELLAIHGQIADAFDEVASDLE